MSKKKISRICIFSGLSAALILSLIIFKGTFVALIATFILMLLIGIGVLVGLILLFLAILFIQAFFIWSFSGEDDKRTLGEIFGGQVI